MQSIVAIQKALDEFFAIRKLDRDPGFSQFVPMVYDPIGFNWREFFCADFVERFNGLLLRGGDQVSTVHLAAFPSTEVLRTFLTQAEPGDLLFTHHPTDMRCGDPRGAWAEGFVPIAPETLHALKDKGLSFYAVHAPLDYHKTINTSLSIARALEVEIDGEFAPYGLGFAGLMGNCRPLSSADLERRLLDIFDIPYIDFGGVRHQRIERIAITAGCGDVVELMQTTEQAGVQAYVTGEIHCHIDNDYGRQRYAEMNAYVATTSLGLYGVSHAASEHLVMVEAMAPWFRRQFGVRTNVIRESHWWR